MIIGKTRTPLNERKQISKRFSGSKRNNAVSEDWPELDFQIIYYEIGRLLDIQIFLSGFSNFFHIEFQRKFLLTLG